MKELKIEDISQEDVLLDTRPKEEFLQASLPGALYLPFANMVHFLAPLVETDQPLVFLVQDQEEALFLEEFVRSQDYEEVRGYVVDALGQWQAAGRQPRTLKTIQAADYDQDRLAEDQVLLDVRNLAEIKLGDPDRHRIILPLKDLGDEYPSLDPAKVYLIRCLSGNRATVAASFLEGRGYQTLVIDGVFPYAGGC